MVQRVQQVELLVVRQQTTILVPVVPQKVEMVVRV
jgi:hypothetical protein